MKAAATALDWKEVVGEGGVTYVSPSKMEVGEEIIGKYLEKFVDARFGGLRYRIQTHDGVTILNGSGQLDFLLKLIKPGAVIRIVYQGKTKIQSGERKGTLAHQFKVYVSEESREE